MYTYFASSALLLSFSLRRYPPYDASPRVLKAAANGGDEHAGVVGRDSFRVHLVSLLCIVTLLAMRRVFFNGGDEHPDVIGRDAHAFPPLRCYSPTPCDATLLAMLRTLLRLQQTVATSIEASLVGTAFMYSYLPPLCLFYLPVQYTLRMFFQAAANGSGEHPGVVPQLPRPADLEQAEGGGGLAPQAPGSEDAAVLEQNPIRAAETPVRGISCWFGHKKHLLIADGELLN